MQQGNRTGRMPEKNGHTVGNRHSHACPPLDREVSIGISAAQPPFPRSPVLDHAIAVNLVRGREPRSERSKRVTESIPPSDHIANRLVAADAKAPGRARCRERVDAAVTDLRNSLEP
jgi:hypothetical protein